MTTPRLSDAKRALGGSLRSYEITIEDGDLTAAATTQSFTMGSLPAGSIVVGYDVDITEAFVGLTAPTVDVGDSGGSSNEYVDDQSIASIARASSMVAIANSDGNGVDVVAKVDDTATNLDQATAGAMTIRVLYLEAEQVIKRN